MENRLSPKITEILSYGKEEATRLGCDAVEPAHLLLAMLREGDCTAVAILRQMGIDALALKVAVESIAAGSSTNRDPLLSDQSSRILKLMFLEARAMKAESADTEHLLLALLRDANEVVCQILNQGGIDYQTVKNALTQKQEPQAGFGFTDEDEEDDEEAAPLSPPEEEPQATRLIVMTTPKVTAKNFLIPFFSFTDFFVRKRPDCRRFPVDGCYAKPKCRLLPLITPKSRPF